MTFPTHVGFVVGQERCQEEEGQGVKVSFFVQIHVAGRDVGTLGTEKSWTSEQIRRGHAVTLIQMPLGPGILSSEVDELYQNLTR